MFVRIGPPGTGKTRWMDETYGIGKWVTTQDNNGHWFDGCDHDAIVFSLPLVPWPDWSGHQTPWQITFVRSLFTSSNKTLFVTSSNMFPHVRPVPFDILQVIAFLTNQYLQIEIECINMITSTWGLCRVQIRHSSRNIQMKTLWIRKYVMITDRTGSQLLKRNTSFTS